MVSLPNFLTDFERPAAAAGLLGPPSYFKINNIKIAEPIYFGN